MSIDKFPVPGGYSQPKDVTDEVQAIAEKMQTQVEEALKQQFRLFKVTRFHTKVVAGLIYLIYINVDEDKMVELTVFQDLKQVLHFNEAKLLE